MYAHIQLLILNTFFKFHLKSNLFIVHLKSYLLFLNKYVNTFQCVYKWFFSYLTDEYKQVVISNFSLNQISSRRFPKILFLSRINSYKIHIREGKKSPHILGSSPYALNNAKMEIQQMFHRYANRFFRRSNNLGFHRLKPGKYLYEEMLNGRKMLNLFLKTIKLLLNVLCVLIWFDLECKEVGE